MALLSALLVPCLAHAQYEEESAYLHQSGGLAVRHENVLTLTLADGTVKILEGCKERFAFSTGCEDYVYNGQIANDRFFIITTWYAMDGSTVEAISRKSGKIENIQNDPHISPKGGFMLSSLFSETDGINGLHLWNIRNGELEKISVEGDDEGYEFVRWNDEHNAEVTRYTYKDPRVDCNFIKTRMLVTHLNNKWQLKELGAPICPSGNN